MITLDMPKLSNKQYRNKFDYTQIKSDYIHEDLDYGELKNKYSLTNSQYQYLRTKGMNEDWPEQRKRIHDLLITETINKRAINKAKSIAKMDKIIADTQDRLVGKYGAMKYKSGGEIAGVMDVCIKNTQLLTGQATDNINISQEADKLSMIVAKLENVDIKAVEITKGTGHGKD